jgi:hypothetical protein
LTPSKKQKGAKSKVGEALIKPFDPKLKKTIQTEATANNGEAVLAAWREGKAAAPTPPDLLKVVVQALVDVAPDALVQEIAEHMQAHALALADANSATQVLYVVARSGKVQLMEALWQVLHRKLKIPPTYTVFEVLLGGYASVGDQKKVEELLEQVRACRLDDGARPCNHRQGLPQELHGGCRVAPVHGDVATWLPDTLVRGHPVLPHRL